MDELRAASEGILPTPQDDEDQAHANTRMIREIIREMRRFMKPEIVSPYLPRRSAKPAVANLHLPSLGTPLGDWLSSQLKPVPIEWCGWRR
jgi:hypothetical protein